MDLGVETPITDFLLLPRNRRPKDQLNPELELR
jgi:hypothetical protein